MSTAPFSVVAVSNDALRPELLDRLLVDVNDCTVIVVESVARAYAKIRQVQPHVVVLLTNHRRRGCMPATLHAAHGSQPSGHQRRHVRDRS